MKLSEFKNRLAELQDISFVQPDGSFVPPHFHITEAGITTKHFIDCGGTERLERYVSFQLWVADDLQHRLQPTKLIGIIEKASAIIGEEDPEVEVEYQGATIGRFGVMTKNNHFLLTSKLTNCLAPDRCGVPAVKPRVKLSELTAAGKSSCNPASGCC